MLFSTDTLLTHANRQKRLFEHSPEIGAFESIEEHSSFLREGYAIVPEIPNELEAVNTCYRIIRALNKSDLFYSDFINSIQLSKADQIPVYESFIGTGFQALHFDYGMPLLPSEETISEGFDMFVALYYPYSTAAPSNAKTRIVPLNTIQKLNGVTKEIADVRIQEYVRASGDDWSQPEGYNSRRLSIFARVVDASLGTRTYAERVDAHSQNFFMPSAIYSNTLEEKQIAMEKEYFAAVGIDLTKVEKQIHLHAGSLLLIDNIRCVHGRIGTRQPKEVWQFLFGLKKTPLQLVRMAREFLAGAMGR